MEDRFTPAVTFQFDYTYDTAGFFTDPARRAMLEQVGRDVAAGITSTPAAIAPGGGNTWTASFFHPATGAQARVQNLTVPAGVLTVFVGARNLDGAAAAQGGYGGYGWAGGAAWGNLIATRGQAFSVWGGSLTFDTDQNWYVGAGAAPLGQTDMYTVATHELGHLLGLGTAPAFRQLTQNGHFTGANATRAYGSAPPVTGDGAHWANDVSSGNQPASLRAYLVTGQRYGLSALEYAALADIGWQVSSTSPPVAVPPPPISPPPAPNPGTTDTTTPPPATPPDNEVEPTPSRCNCGACVGCVAVGGPAGTVRMYDLSQPTQATALGDEIRPFAGFNGVVRAAAADVNADGTPDLIAVTGPDGGSRVRVIDGKEGTDLLPAYSVFEAGYTGGLFVAAADLDGDGRAEVIVSPDRGGGGRVTVLRVANGSAQVTANFMGIEDANFRGGARVAAADVSGDGVADVVVGAGFGGGPRVAIFDGASLSVRPRKLTNDFYAFDGADATNLRNGIFPAAGDLDGDGRAELIFGGGPGGGPRVFALSGALVLTSLDAARAAPVANFFAFGSWERGGVHPAVRDVNRDGQSDLVVGSGEYAQAGVNVYLGGPGRWSGGNPVSVAEHEPFGFAALADGVYVG